MGTIGGKRPGAGRPRRNGKKGELLSSSGIVYLTEMQRKNLSKQASEEDLTMSELLRRIIEGYLSVRKTFGNKTKFSNWLSRDSIGKE